MHMYNGRPQKGKKQADILSNRLRCCIYMFFSDSCVKIDVTIDYYTMLYYICTTVADVHTTVLLLLLGRLTFFRCVAM